MSIIVRHAFVDSYIAKFFNVSPHIKANPVQHSLLVRKEGIIFLFYPAKETY